MKKLFILLILGLMSCNEVTNPDKDVEYIDQLTKISVVEKDGHEYILVTRGSEGGTGICHSESCPNH